VLSHLHIGKELLIEEFPDHLIEDDYRMYYHASGFDRPFLPTTTNDRSGAIDNSRWKRRTTCSVVHTRLRSAMLYSLLGTCKLHDLNPSEWLMDVLRRIGDHPVNRISALPHNWRPAQSWANADD
jgi:hypothetical protein